ncbi:phage tail spike protein [Clostridium beijerinckii]|uniref:phage tail spike protein n=1 Tax=Clostridium beijerinckii TaxID=1520 RepID=UPI00232B1DF1|nr:phage tail spike protein [Clostridium beijerinckii]
MIRLFRNNETNFNHNEFVLNEIISCKPTEAINDDYTAELEYPLEDGKGISSNLVVGGIISIPTIDNRPDQLFRIINKETSLTTVTVQMQAKLLADLKENRIRAMTLTGLTRKQAVQAVLNAALDPHSYSVGNLDTNTNTNVIVNIPEGNLLSAIIGAENSILSAYGGEFIVNNNTIDIVDSRGSDNGVVIEYGKNLSSIKESINLTDLATVLIPKSGDYRLPEYCIESSRVNQYEKRYFKDVDLNLNIWDGDGEKGENQITIEEAYTIMRDTCNKMFTVDKVDQITFNYEVDFVELGKTEEYKNYAILETVHEGDTVTIRHKKLNLDLQGRVNKTAYSVDSEGNKTIDTVEIGFSRKEITNIINDTAITANNANNKINQITETSTDGVTTELSKKAFKVTCSKASGTNVIIDAEGLTVNNGKILVKNSSGSTVFTVNTEGVCTAIGGFIASDDNTECTITANDGLVIENDKYKCQINDDGIRITNLDTGYTGLITVDDVTRLSIPDDLIIGKTLNVKGFCSVGGNFRTIGDANIGGDVSLEGTLWVNGRTLEEIIDSRIPSSPGSDS